MKKEIIRINNLSYKVKDGDEEKMLQVPEKQHFYMQFQGC